MISRTNDDTSTPFKIAIIGGGIGGLFCALCIHHHCTSSPDAPPIHIDVYEQASAYKEIGAGVGIGVNAARLVHQMGLGERLNAIAGHRSGVWITFRKFDDGGEIVTIPVKDNQTIRQAPCARSELLDFLKNAVEERKAATLWTKKGCTNVEDQGSSVLINFNDSTTATANLVIAADGIHSNVRNQFAPDRPVYSGQIAYRGVIPISSLEPFWKLNSYSVAWLAKHRHFLVFPIAANTQLNIVAFVTKDEQDVKDVKESWTSVCDRKDVEGDFEGFEEVVQKVIRLMPEQPSKWRLNDREPLEEWSNMDGKVVLLGDSAHAMLPHLGAGAGQAMEDGWVLGRALSEHLAAASSSSSASNPHFSTLNSTMSLYQSVRRPRAQKTQATSRRAGNEYEMQSEQLLKLSFDDCLPVIAENMKERMKWVWEENLDEAYEGVRDKKE